MEKRHKEQREKGGDRIGGRRLRKTPYKKQKMMMIMNQKANSIADLAAVLREQVEMGRELGSEREKEEEVRRRKLFNIAVQLAGQAKNGGLEKLDSQITEATTTLETLQTKPTEERTKDDKTAIKTAKKTVAELRARRAKMEAVHYLVTEAREEHARLSQSALGSHMAQAEADAKAAGRAFNAEEASAAVEIAKFDLAAVLRDNIYGLGVFHEENKLPDPSKLPKRGPARKAMKETLSPAPVFTPEGVRVRWANILDAEFAAEWPEKVQHDVIGLVRNCLLYTSPSPRDGLLSRMPSSA